MAGTISNKNKVAEGVGVVVKMFHVGHRRRLA